MRIYPELFRMSKVRFLKATVKPILDGLILCNLFNLFLKRTSFKKLWWLWFVPFSMICNTYGTCSLQPDVAPRLTSGGYEDKVYVINPNKILFKRGGEFWSLMKIKMMFISPINILLIGGGNVDPLWRKSQHVVHRGWQILIPHDDKVDVITPVNILFIGGGEFWSLMKIKMMFLRQPTYCSCEFWSLMKIQLMFLSQPTYCSWGVANFDPSWDIVGVIAPSNTLFRGGG